jgi:hypothetical protein
MSERDQRGRWGFLSPAALPPRTRPLRGPDDESPTEHVSTTPSGRAGSGPRRLLNAAVRAVGRVNWTVIGIVLIVKAILFVFGAVAFQVLLDQPLSSSRALLEIWNRWDAPHYLALAQFGYQDEGEIRLFLVFFPMFPLLVRIVAVAVGDYLVSALLVSTVASVAAGLLLYRLVRLDATEEIAQRAVVFLLIFPTSYFLHVGYTESVFLAFVLGSVLAARGGNWAAAGLLGAGAAFTRMNGAFLIPVLAVEAFQQYRERGRWNLGVIWIGAIALGTLGYLAINYTVTGDPFRFLTIQQSHWIREMVPPWEGIRNLHGYINWQGNSYIQLVGVQELTFVMLGLAGSVAAWLVLRPSYAVWMTLNWLLFVSNSFIASTPRYTLTLFPLFIIFAALAQNRLWNTALTTWSLLFLALFTSQFVMGRWAF